MGKEKQARKKLTLDLERNGNIQISQQAIIEYYDRSPHIITLYKNMNSILHRQAYTYINN